MSRGMEKIKRKIEHHENELEKVYKKMDDADHLPCLPQDLIEDRDYHQKEKNRLLKWSGLCS